MKLFVVAALVAGMGFGLGVPAAQAATVDLIATGKITTVGGNPQTVVAADDLVTFRLTYATTAVDTNPDPDRGTYAPVSFGMTFGGQSYSFTNNLNFGLWNQTGATDVIGISYFAFPQDANGIAFVDLHFNDLSGTAFSDDGLPDLATLQTMIGEFGFMFVAAGNTGPSDATGTIISVAAVAATPIPAALPLLASAFGGLGLLGWYRRRADRRAGATAAAAVQA